MGLPPTVEAVNSSYRRWVCQWKTPIEPSTHRTDAEADTISKDPADAAKARHALGATPSALGACGQSQRFRLRRLSSYLREMSTPKVLAT
jgi:hypothetical protein